MNEAYETTKRGNWTRRTHHSGVSLETRPIGAGLTRTLISQLKPAKQVPRCGEVVILSTREDTWHVEIVNKGQYLHLQRWEY